MFTLANKAFLNNLNKYQALGRKPKDVIAVADSRAGAEEVKQNIIDQIDFYDHNKTGTMENSIAVRPLGGGEYGVTAVEYAKFVNGRDREATGTGFVDDAVNEAILDGVDAQITI